MPKLLIETSTERAVVGLVKKNKVLFEKELPQGLNNAKYLAPAVEDALRTLKNGLRDVSAIAVGIGPGSYTGIRAGVMLAKALAFAAEKPLIGVCALECFLPTTDVRFAVLFDARIGGVYCILGHKKNDKVVYESNPQVVPLIDLKRVLSKVQTITTPRVKPLIQKIECDCPPVTWEELPPNLIQMAKVAQKNYEENKIAIEDVLDLMYLRKTGAELEKEAREKFIFGDKYATK